MKHRNRIVIKSLPTQWRRILNAPRQQDADYETRPELEQANRVLTGNRVRNVITSCREIFIAGKFVRGIFAGCRTIESIFERARLGSA